MITPLGKSLCKRMLILILICHLLLVFNSPELTVVNSNIQNTSFNLLIEQNVVQTEFNSYYPDGNISVLVAVDTHLLGEDELFIDFLDVKMTFESWMLPFETRFNNKFHVCNVTTFTPGEDDSLDVSIEKVANDLSWTFSSGVNDPSVNGNNYDFLIIFQEEYNTGQNRANAIYGNALIISHNQLWTSDQLILLHEIGHLFGGVHDENGSISPQSYGSASRSIMSYDDILNLTFSGWDRSFLPVDDDNFEIINSSVYRFDQNDADLDGLPNYYEFRYAMNPCLDEASLDLDNDGLNDLNEYLSGTHPLQGDTDNDNYSDWAEDYFDTSPINTSDFPDLSEPLVVAWSNDQEITGDQQLTLQWRGTATNKETYSIFKNESLLIASQWAQELISYEITGLDPGRWIFKCIVTDSNGISADASIKIIIHKKNQVPIEGAFTILAMLTYILIKRKKLL
ncbi:MAG: M12 family metallo-peptidase, partial [Candidatus Hodarchaeales archaeon]